ncbi:MAG: DEDD exonuclease domain-containing protein [Rubricoccaceae bacterium]
MPFDPLAPLAQAPFVVVDTETTGARAGEDRLIEIGAVRLVGGKVVDRFQQLIDPGRHVPHRITQLTGISTAMVYGQPGLAETMPRLRAFLADDVLVAHNLPFDQRFLDLALDEAGLPPLQNPALCTLRLARRLLPALASKGLSSLTRHFEISVHGRHRALGDAEATAHLLWILLGRLRTEFGAETVADVLAFQRKRYQDTRREPAHLVRIREGVLPGLPDRPGVYFMRDRQNRVIYVGKAKSLRGRVRSYFTSVDNHPPRTKKLVRDVRDVTWRETGTELSALLEESRLIKTLLPVYNRAQRRYRDYPFLRLDTTHPFPTLSWTPRIAHDGAEYYGPLGRRGQAEELTELIARLFRLRECDDPVFALGRPCLYHTMGRCGAPCAGGAGAAAYAAEVERVRAFLTGHDTEALEAVEAAMHEAAAALEFEAAGWYRDQLRRLRRTLGRQRQIAAPVHEHHAVLVEPLAGGAGAQLFLIRHGRLVARHDLPAAPDAADRDALAAQLAEHFDPTMPPPETHLRADVDEIRILAHWMRLHPDPSRQVRWHDGLGAEAFLEAVLAAAAQAVPDAAEAVGEDD